MGRRQAEPIARVNWPLIASASSLSGVYVASTLVPGLGGVPLTCQAPTDEGARRLVRESPARHYAPAPEQGGLFAW